MNRQKYKCTTCNTNFQTKHILKSHESLCVFIHTSAKEHSINNEFIKQPLPSQKAMFQYILHLTNKYNNLEEKVAKLEKKTNISFRKNFNEYIKTLEKPSINYTTWVQSIQITEHDLLVLFENDLESCLKNILHTLITNDNDVPIRAFTEKQHRFYIYDTTEWRTIDTEEFKKMISLISHKVLRKYTEWAKEHREEWVDNQQMQDRAMIYLSKANGMNSSSETRTSNIKKWLFTKIHKSLNHVDA